MAPSDSLPELSAANVRHYAQQLGCPLTDEQAKALGDFSQLLRRWNRVHNLTALDSDRDLLTHHLLDSLAIVPTLRDVLAQAGKPARVLDAGSGAGLPGIPVAVALPDVHVTLIDAVQKKCAFIEQVRVELSLSNVSVRHCRLEQARIPAQHVIVSRAFATLAQFVAVTRHLLEPTGTWIAMKGKLPDSEIEQLPAGVQVSRTVKLRIPLLPEVRHLVLLRPD